MQFPINDNGVTAAKNNKVPLYSFIQFDQESGRRRTTMWMCYLQIVIYLFMSL